MSDTRASVPDMPLSDVTRSSVLTAMEEFDRIGREAFLKKYGFGPAHEYVVVHEGRAYDSKAIVGVAHGAATGRALERDEFSGGLSGAAAALDSLGFEIYRRL